MKAVDSVRDLITEDNLSLTFFSESENSITIKALGQKQHAAEKEALSSAKKRKVQRNIKTLCWESQMVLWMKKR